MLKAEIKPHDDKQSVSIEISGDLRRICADISTLIHAVNERLTNNDPALGHEFKVLFTKGFMDGVCFGDDREHMNHYLAEGDDRYEKVVGKHAEFMKFLNDMIDFLKDKNATLERINSELEDDDEAE